MMEVAKNEIMFIYDSKDLKDRKAFGYVKSLGNYYVKELDLQKNTLTETQLEVISQRLKVNAKQLIDKQSHRYFEKYANKRVTNEDARKILGKNPDMIKTPIVLYHDRAEFVDSSYEFINKGMTFLNHYGKHCHFADAN